MDKKGLENITDKARRGIPLDYIEAIILEKSLSTVELSAIAAGLRKDNHGENFDTCSIMNARSGRCPENCKWCSQSVFHKSDIEIYPLVGAEQAIELACHNASKGVGRFSLVTSGRAMTDQEVESSCEIYRAISEKSNIYLCASMGLLSREQLKKLYDSGVRRYHCNLETAPSYFRELCTTHTTGDKIQTILSAMEVGMEVCSGGIIGMGESMAQRIELAVVLRDLGITSIPVNILNPIPGTALEKQPSLCDDQIIRSVAMFRIINPASHIRLAGGRIRIKHLERELLHAGVSAAIVGDMLTTTGSDIESDRKMVNDEGFRF